MNLFVLLFVLQALSLATSARPLFPLQNQQAIAISPPLTPPSSVNSFDSSSDLESGSGSERGSKKFSFSNPLKKIKPSSSGFRCHRYPQNSILGELSAYVTDLLRSYRDTVFRGKGHQERPRFETCYAGFDSSDVSPSIYFGNMKAKEIGVVEKLFKNQLLMKFPAVRIVKTSNAIAVVVEGREKIKRRSTP
ncbi:MAG: hypothetical protein ALECFALPRED_008448 [Alectoria fallacina]|uniref:Uncharacterized protein n=1 Tax=Alectoria fallacina TaxID=1903189 RepID=A0A8H3I2W6_9LECA|nr:MAG: hypothetical protein ALECFALPRED_008448 [Alectoria fallacina]